MTITIQTIPYADGSFLHVTRTVHDDGTDTIAYQEFAANGEPLTDVETL